MRTWKKPPLLSSSLLIRSGSYISKSICSVSICQASSESVRSEIQVTELNPLSKDHGISDSSIRSHVIDVLLSLRNKPFDALKYFERVETQPNLAGVAESFYVVLHILMTPKTQSSAASLLRRWVSGHQCPSPSIVVNQFLDTAKRLELGSDFRVFNYLLYAYAEAGRLQDAICCFDLMIENAIPSWVPRVNELLNKLVKNNMIKEAKLLYGKMTDREVRGDSETIHLLMRACLKEGEAGEAMEYFKEAIYNGVKLGVGAYGCAVGIVSKIPDSSAACELLSEMRELGWVPSEGTFTSAIVACVKQGNIRNALRLKDQMVSCGRRMNVVVATSLIKGHCVSGDLQSALYLFKQICLVGPSPNKVTFSVLIKGCCSMGNMEKASLFLSQMSEMGIEPSVFILNSMIEGFLSLHLWEKAFEVFDRAVESGRADSFTYNTLIIWLCKDGKLEEALKVWAKMENSGMRPGLISYNSLILGHCKNGSVDRADNLFSELMEKGFKPNAHSFTMLINGLFQKGLTETALGRYEEMVRLGVDRTGYTYNTIINGLCKVGKTYVAKDMLDKFIEEDKFVPTSMTYNSIIYGFVKENMLDSAVGVFNDMCNKGFPPTIITFTTLMDGLCKCNDVDAAMRVKDGMRGMDVEMDIRAYGTLIHGFCKRRDMETASRLFSELREVGLSPNRFIYNSMISGFQRS